MLEDPMIDVMKGPLLLKPLEYEDELINGIHEINNKITIRNINGCLSRDISLVGSIVE
jgi:hypothetical protein